MAIPQPTRFEVGQANTTFVDVASWTQGALQSLDLNAPIRGTSTALAIPLDDGTVADGQGITAGEAVRSGHVLRRKTSNRDSLRHRDTLLKGKEGSRQRRRWENGSCQLLSSCALSWESEH